MKYIKKTPDLNIKSKTRAFYRRKGSAQQFF